MLHKIEEFTEIYIKQHVGMFAALSVPPVVSTKKYVPFID